MPATHSANALIAIPGFADPVSSISHLAGAAVFAALSVLLVRKARRTPGGATRGRIVSLVIFSFAAVLLLSMSAVFHLLPLGTPVRHVFQRLDHAAIFILIAGTFTPIHAIMFKGPWRWGMLAFIWTFAVLGVALKSIFFRETPEALGIVLYVAMGWVGLASIIALARRAGLAPVLTLLLGGLAYTVGAAVEGINPRPLVAAVIRSHELFHAAVLLGLALHWRFIWSIADAPSPAGPNLTSSSALPPTTGSASRSTRRTGCTASA